MFSFSVSLPFFLPLYKRVGVITIPTQATGTSNVIEKWIGLSNSEDSQLSTFSRKSPDLASQTNQLTDAIIHRGIMYHFYMFRFCCLVSEMLEINTQRNMKRSRNASFKKKFRNLYYFPRQVYIGLDWFICRCGTCSGIGLVKGHALRK